MDVRSYIEENAASFFGDLKQWLRIPSISADPPATAMCARLRSGSRLPQRPGSPRWRSGRPDRASPGAAVYAHWPAADPGAPKVLSTATMTSSP